MPVVTPLSPSDVPLAVAHLARGARESGRDGDPFARARSADEPVDEEATRARVAERGVWPISALGWERWWLLWDDDGGVRGHLDLRGAEIASALHRARVGIGIERGWRRQGWGRQLMTEAITWARAEGLRWLDLGVFADNAPARALYRQLGFVEVGTVPDAFRIDGRSVEDVSMVLDLTT